jgi:hypothetical protein
MLNTHLCWHAMPTTLMNLISFFRVGIDSQASSLMDSVFADCMSVGCQLLAAEKCTLALNAFQCEPQEFG